MLLPVRPPYLLRKFYNRFLWRMPQNENKVYLTFDDGPIPEVTEFVLDTLKKFSARATFFCLGKNVGAHPDIFERIIKEGHKAGNHTYNHLNGWNTNSTDYLSDVQYAEKYIQSRLFRPPYGRIRKAQADEICKNYQVVMWDVLSYDFSTNVSADRCLKNVISNSRPGSIIVFHDSLKAWPNLQFALPRSLEYFKSNGIEFGLIEQ